MMKLLYSYCISYSLSLNNMVEIMVSRTKEKAVILPHSIGAAINFYFLKWVEHQDPTWIDKHIHVHSLPFQSHFLTLIK